jgi:hypothetical protein
MRMLWLSVWLVMGTCRVSTAIMSYWFACGGLGWQRKLKDWLRESEDDEDRGVAIRGCWMLGTGWE